MYLFNQPWCGACKRLKQTFQDEGATIAKLSEKFILVNVGGDDNSAFGCAAATPSWTMYILLETIDMSSGMQHKGLCGS